MSTTSSDADAAVDRLVVADSWARMDDTRRRVLKVGVAATSIEDLASELDLPVATVNGHLRIGLDLLQAELADSRADGDDAGLADVVVDGIPDLELIEPPVVVWNAVVAELRLSGDAADIDRETRAPVPESHSDPEPEPDEGADGGRADGAVDDENVLVTADSTETSEDKSGHLDDGGSENGAEDGDVDGGHGTLGARPDHQVKSDQADAEEKTPDDAMDDLRADAVSTKLDRPIWQNPVAVVVALIILAVLIAIVF